MVNGKDADWEIILTIESHGSKPGDLETSVLLDVMMGRMSASFCRESCDQNLRLGENPLVIYRLFKDIYIYVYFYMEPK